MGEALAGLGDVQAELSDLSGGVGVVQTDITDLLARIGEPSSTVFSLLGDVLAQLGDVLGGIADIETMIAAIDLDFTSLIQQMQSLAEGQDQGVAAILAAIAQAEASIQQSLDALGSDLAGILAAIAQVNQGIVDLQSELDRHDSRVRSMLTGLSADVAQAFSDLQSQLTTHDTEIKEQLKEEPAAGETHGLPFWLLGEMDGEWVGSVGFWLTTSFAGQAVNVTEPFDSTIVVTVLNGTDGTDHTSPGNITIGYVDVGIYSIYVANLSYYPVCEYGPIMIAVDWTYTDPITSHVYYGRDYWLADFGNFYSGPPCWA